METTRRAVIDVGTNSIKLLIADVSGGTVTPVVEDSEQTRLGAGFFETSRLQPQAVAHSAEAVATFAAKARELGAISARVIATSAARDAVNPEDLTSAIERASGLRVEIISGEQEADWAFQGVTTDARLAQVPLLLMDLGGGSTEFILGEGRAKSFRKSYRLGTVRLLEKLSPGDPPTAEQLAACRKFVREFLSREVLPELGLALKELSQRQAASSAVQWVGTGGTATILGRMAGQLESYDRERIESPRITSAQIRARVDELWGLPLAERKEIIGLPKSRADVILSGVAIYEGVMEVFGFGELRISTRGLRFAAVMEN
jgi:exopolyphosphatase/guanosine-5'-triphosphate,3'-diphosphate pyrophosphatase